MSASINSLSPTFHTYCESNANAVQSNLCLDQPSPHLISQGDVPSFAPTCHSPGLFAFFRTAGSHIDSQFYRVPQLSLEALSSQVRWEEEISGAVYAAALFETFPSKRLKVEVALVGYPESNHVWQPHVGNEVNMGNISTEAAIALLVHTHPAGLSPKPSPADAASAKRYESENQSARAVVSEDGIYIFHPKSKSVGTGEERKVRNMILIPDLRINLVNQEGALLLYPIDKSYIPVIFINET